MQRNQNSRVNEGSLTTREVGPGRLRLLVLPEGSGLSVLGDASITPTHTSDGSTIAEIEVGLQRRCEGSEAELHSPWAVSAALRSST